MLVYESRGLKKISVPKTLQKSWISELKTGDICYLLH